MWYSSQPGFLATCFYLILGCFARGSRFGFANMIFLCLLLAINIYVLLDFASYLVLAHICFFLPWQFQKVDNLFSIWIIAASGAFIVCGPLKFISISNHDFQRSRQLHFHQLLGLDLKSFSRATWDAVNHGIAHRLFDFQSGSVSLILRKNAFGCWYY